MNFFIDRCVSRRIARMLEVYQEGIHLVRYFDDDKQFKSNTPDIEWMMVLAEDTPPWTVITSDVEISRNKVEQGILSEVPMKFFFLARQRTKMQLQEQVWKFLKIWPDIERIARSDQGRLFLISGSRNLSITRQN